MDIKTVTVSVVVSLVGAVAISLLMKSSIEQSFAEQIKERPPVAIIDFTKLVAEKQLEQGVTPEEVESLMDGISKTVVTLHESGYVIFDASTVVGAPEALYVSKEEIMK